MPLNFFNSSFGNLTWVFLRTDEKEFNVEAEGGKELLPIWTSFAVGILFQGLSGSIPKGYNTPKGPTSQGSHRIP